MSVLAEETPCCSTTTLVKSAKGCSHSPSRFLCCDHSSRGIKILLSYKNSPTVVITVNYD